jgi:hypothetical protein
VEHLVIRAVTDPEGLFDSANPRFTPPVRGGKSFGVWVALISCCLSFSRDTKGRAVVKDSQENLLTLNCMGNGDIVVGTETDNEQQGVEVIIESDHDFFALLCNVFKSLGIANSQDRSKEAPIE